MESARIANFVNDKETIWFIDDVYGGLYSFDMDNSSDMAECHITPADYRLGGDYKIVEMINTTDEVLMIPLDMHNPIRIYNKNTREESQKTIEEINYKIEGVFCNGNEMVLIPVTPSDPLCSINLSDYTVRTIKNRLLEDCPDDGEIWEHSLIKDIALTISHTPFLIKMNKDDMKYETIRLKDGEKIKSAFFDDGDIWVLPFDGVYIKKYDAEGKLNETIDISQYGVLDEYVRILSIHEHIILLPKNTADLLIINQKENSFCSIDLTGKGMICKYVNEKRNNIAYWRFYIEDTTICLLPLERKMIKYNLENDNYWFVDIYSVSDTDLNNWAYQKMKIDINENGMVKEETKDDLRTFLSII